jgi:hypothetical protein
MQMMRRRLWIEEVRMRWQQLFSDLEAQFEQAQAATEWGESASRARAEMGALRLADRLRGSVGERLVLRCRGAEPLRGELLECGADWLLVEDERGQEVLAAVGAVLAVGGLARRSTAPDDGGVVRTRLDFRRAVRGLARDRSPVRLVLDDGTVLTGTVDRVGADHCELAEHPVDEPRRAEAVRGVQTVPLAAVSLVVRSASVGPG